MAKKRAGQESDSAPVRMSLRGYSEHRRTLGLRGHSLLVIQRAIKTGRIARTCEAHNRCPPNCSAGKIDPERCDRDWVAYTTPGADRAMDAPDLLAAKVLRETWAGRNERLKFEERAGSLVSAEKIQSMLYGRGRHLRELLTQTRLQLTPQLAVEKNPRRIDRMLGDAFAELLKTIAL